MSEVSGDYRGEPGEPLDMWGDNVSLSLVPVRADDDGTRLVSIAGRNGVAAQFFCTLDRSEVEKVALFCKVWLEIEG